MDPKEIYKRIWQAPDGNAYFGIFSDGYPDHLFNVTEFLYTLYTVELPQEIAGDLNKLVIEYFLEATRKDDRCTSTKGMFDTAEPVVWFRNRIMKCIVDNWSLIDEYKKAMGLPVSTTREDLDRYNNLNNLER